MVYDIKELSSTCNNHNFEGRTIHARFIGNDLLSLLGVYLMYMTISVVRVFFVTILVDLFNL